MYLSFSLTKNQTDQLLAWKIEEGSNNNLYNGRFTYKFTPSKLGLAVFVEDNVTGKTLNLTDFNEFG